MIGGDNRQRAVGDSSPKCHLVQFGAERGVYLRERLVLFDCLFGEEEVLRARLR